MQPRWKTTALLEKFVFFPQTFPEHLLGSKFCVAVGGSEVPALVPDGIEQRSRPQQNSHSTWREAGGRAGNVNVLGGKESKPLVLKASQRGD